MNKFLKMLTEALSKDEIEKHMTKNSSVMMKKKDKYGNPQFKLRGHKTIQGIPFAVENLKNDIRAGIDPDGEPWENKMGMDYGYIKGSLGNDGDSIDTYLGDDLKSDRVFIVKQHAIEEMRKWKTNNCPICGNTPENCWDYYDEDKLLMFMSSKESAIKMYDENYNSKLFRGPIIEISIDELKKQLKDANGKKLTFDKTNELDRKMIGCDDIKILPVRGNLKSLVVK